MGGLNNVFAPSYESEHIIWGAPNTGDLEATTKTITATTEASGTGSADYSKTATYRIKQPTSSKISILRLCSRLAVTIDSMTATHLYCKVYVDVQDANHLLFSEDWTTTGAKLDAVDLHAGNKAALFAVLNDGLSHNVYFYFWVDAGNAVVSLVQGWLGVGSCITGANAPCFSITLIGTVQLTCYWDKIGTGSPGVKILDSNSNIINGGISQNVLTATTSNGTVFVSLLGTVNTDLNHINNCQVTLRGGI